MKKIVKKSKKVVKVKKINKVKLLRKLKNKCDKLWSVFIRLRDGKCVLCGSVENGQAHHCIVRCALANSTRWEKTNGIRLCAICHLYKIHRDADKDILEKYLAYLNSHIPQEEQVRLKELSRSGKVMEIEDLQKIEWNLTLEIELLQKKS